MGDRLQLGARTGVLGYGVHMGEVEESISQQQEQAAARPLQERARVPGWVLQQAPKASFQEQEAQLSALVPSSYPSGFREHAGSGLQSFQRRTSSDRPRDTNLQGSSAHEIDSTGAPCNDL